MTSHRPRKRFGQHFLRDNAVVQRIVGAFAPRRDDSVVEIGPGEGALTKELIRLVRPLHVVELDRDLAARLRTTYPPDQLMVHEADALDFDFQSLVPRMEVPMSRETGSRERPPLEKKLRVIGNLPYNISTPLLFHLLDQINCISDMLFMLQKEVVDRMAAAPDTADYGRLSVMIQCRVKVEPLFDVPPQAFFPPPRVDSTVVLLTPHSQAPIQVRDNATFSRVVKIAFANRRKTLRNNLKGVADGAKLQALGIDPNRRAETLTLDEFARIANECTLPSP